MFFNIKFKVKDYMSKRHSRSRTLEKIQFRITKDKHLCMNLSIKKILLLLLSKNNPTFNVIVFINKNQTLMIFLGKNKIIYKILNQLGFLQNRQLKFFLHKNEINQRMLE